MKKTGMVFGVFDGLHPGHKYFLNEAARQSGKLIVVVALLETVQKLKKRDTKNSLQERMIAIQDFNPRLIVVEGDSELRDWNVLKTHKPDVVFLGYDQQALANEIKKLGVEYSFIDSHFPEKYKSSLLS